MRKFILAVLSIMSLLAVGLVVTQPASAATSAVPQLTHQSYTLKSATSAIVPKGTTNATNEVPLNNWQFSFSAASGNTERLLCLKDYTPETTTWNPHYTAQDWAAANNWFHMFWDDMNGGGDNCGGYDHFQTINMYSYAGGTGQGCADIDLTTMLENNKVRVYSVTIWLNRTADSYNCRYSPIMRQNMTTRVVGWALGIGWDYSPGPSLMNVAWGQRIAYTSLLAADKAASNAQYSDS